MSPWRVLPAALYALASPLGALAQPGYVDQVLEQGPQPVSVAPAPDQGSSGWPRSVRVDYSLARDSGVFSGTTHGLAVAGFLDTPNHGALSVSAALNASRRGSAGWDRAELWRIDQIGLPLNGGWLAHHSAGHISGPQVALARGFGRFGLPGSQLEGASMQYQQGPSASYHLSLGKPGTYAGLGTTGFESAPGRLLLAGLQQPLATWPGSTFAAQWSQADDIGDRAGGRRSDRAAWAAWHWQGQAPWADHLASGNLPVHQRRGGLEVQANVLRSQGHNGDAALGGWFDARWRGDWVAHSAGVFQLDPGLRWLDYEAPSDLRGLYWRGDISSRQWYVSLLGEWSESVSNRASAVTFASVLGRYRIDTRNTVIGTLAVRHGNGSGQSLQLAWDTTHALGQTQLQMNVLQSPDRRGSRMALDHSMAFGPQSTLGVSLGLERNQELGRRTDALTWGLLATTRPWTSVTLDANLRASHSSDSRLVNGSIGIGWTLTPQWSLQAQWNHSRGSDLRPVAVLSPISEAITQPLTASQSTQRLQITLRYQDSAGQAMAPLGGTPGSGAGTLSGHVYFDGNDNGRRDASEAGVPDVVMRLDGRFVTRTDAQGRYEYPAVAPGSHRLEVIADNVPLPWSPAASGPQPVEVRVRDLTLRDFPVRREP
jgi:hypothetical protein